MLRRAVAAAAAALAAGGEPLRRSLPAAAPDPVRPQLRFPAHSSPHHRLKTAAEGRRPAAAPPLGREAGAERPRRAHAQQNAALPQRPQCSGAADYTMWDGSDYEGSQSRTMGGYECLPWETGDARFASLPGNLCRNPNRDPNGPWCRTGDPAKEVDYCDVGSPCVPDHVWTPLRPVFQAVSPRDPAVSCLPGGGNDLSDIHGVRAACPATGVMSEQVLQWLLNDALATAGEWLSRALQVPELPASPPVQQGGARLTLAGEDAALPAVDGPGECALLGPVGESALAERVSVPLFALMDADSDGFLSYRAGAAAADEVALFRGMLPERLGLPASALDAAAAAVGAADGCGGPAGGGRCDGLLGFSDFRAANIAQAVQDGLGAEAFGALTNPNALVYTSFKPCAPGQLAQGYSCARDRYGRPYIAHLNICSNNLPAGNPTGWAAAVRDFVKDVVRQELGYGLGWGAAHAAHWELAVGHRADGARYSPLLLLERDPSSDSGGAWLNAPVAAECLGRLLGCGAGAAERPGLPWNAALDCADDLAQGTAAGTCRSDPGMRFTECWLALFEDSGWYKPNYAAAELPSYGAGAGCALLESRPRPTLWPAARRDAGLVCKPGTGAGPSADRMAIAYCDAVEYTAPLPRERRYFGDDTVGGGDPHARYVPQMRPFANGYCADPGGAYAAVQGRYGEAWGIPTARAFRSNIALRGQPAHAREDVRCLRHTCAFGLLAVVLPDDVLVWCEAPRGGTAHVPYRKSRYEGWLLCPPRAALCPGSGLEEYVVTSTSEAVPVDTTASPVAYPPREAGRFSAAQSPAVLPATWAWLQLLGAAPSDAHPADPCGWRGHWRPERKRCQCYRGFGGQFCTRCAYGFNGSLCSELGVGPLNWLVAEVAASGSAPTGGGAAQLVSGRFALHSSLAVPGNGNVTDGGTNSTNSSGAGGEQELVSVVTIRFQRPVVLTGLRIGLPNPETAPSAVAVAAGEGPEAAAIATAQLDPSAAAPFAVVPVPDSPTVAALRLVFTGSPGRGAVHELSGIRLLGREALPAGVPPGAVDSPPVAGGAWLAPDAAPESCAGKLVCLPAAGAAGESGECPGRLVDVCWPYRCGGGLLAADPAERGGARGSGAGLRCPSSCAPSPPLGWAAEWRPCAEGHWCSPAGRCLALAEGSSGDARAAAELELSPRRGGGPFSSPYGSAPPSGPGSAPALAAKALRSAATLRRRPQGLAVSCPASSASCRPPCATCQCGGAACSAPLASSCRSCVAGFTFLDLGEADCTGSCVAEVAAPWAGGAVAGTYGGSYASPEAAAAALAPRWNALAPAYSSIAGAPGAATAEAAACWEPHPLEAARLALCYRTEPCLQGVYPIPFGDHAACKRLCLSSGSCAAVTLSLSRCWAFSCVPDLVPCYAWNETGRTELQPGGYGAQPGAGWWASFSLAAPGSAACSVTGPGQWRDFPLRTAHRKGWMPALPGQPAQFRQCGWPGSAAGDECYSACGRDPGCAGFMCPCADTYAGAGGAYAGPDCWRAGAAPCVMLASLADWTATDAQFYVPGVHHMVTARRRACAGHADCGASVCGRDAAAGGEFECWDHGMGQCDGDARCRPGLRCLPEPGAHCAAGAQGDPARCQEEVAQFYRQWDETGFSPCAAQLNCRCQRPPSRPACRDELCPSGHTCAGRGAGCRLTCAADSQCRRGYVCDGQCARCVPALRLAPPDCFPYSVGECNSCRESCADDSECAAGWGCDLAARPGRCCEVSGYDPAARGPCPHPVPLVGAAPIRGSAESGAAHALQRAAAPHVRRGRAMAELRSDARARAAPDYAPVPVRCSPSSGFVPGSRQWALRDYLAATRICERYFAHYGCDLSDMRCKPKALIVVEPDLLSTPCAGDAELCGGYACGASRNCAPRPTDVCRTWCSADTHCKRGWRCAGSMVCVAHDAASAACVSCDPCDPAAALVGAPEAAECAGPALGQPLRASAPPAGPPGAGAAPSCDPRDRESVARFRELSGLGEGAQISCRWNALQGQWCVDSTGPVAPSAAPAGPAVASVCSDDAQCAPYVCARGALPPTVGGLAAALASTARGQCRVRCEHSGHCYKDLICAEGLCAPRRPSGVACSAPAHCLSGHCVGGVCCAAPCSGPCLTCNAPFAPAGECVAAEGRGGCGPCELCAGGGCVPAPPAPCAGGRGRCAGGACVCHFDAVNGFWTTPSGAAAGAGGGACSACVSGYGGPRCTDPAPEHPRQLPIAVVAASHRTSAGTDFAGLLQGSPPASAAPDWARWGPRVNKDRHFSSGASLRSDNPADNFVQLRFAHAVFARRVIVTECWDAGSVTAIEALVHEAPADPGAHYAPGFTAQGVSLAPPGGPRARWSPKHGGAAQRWVRLWSGAAPPAPVAGACHELTAPAAGRLPGPTRELRIWFRAYSDAHVLGSVALEGSAAAAPQPPPPAAAWPPGVGVSAAPAAREEGAAPAPAAPHLLPDWAALGGATGARRAHSLQSGSAFREVTPAEVQQLLRGGGVVAGRVLPNVPWLGRLTGAPRVQRRDSDWAVTIWLSFEGDAGSVNDNVRDLVTFDLAAAARVDKSRVDVDAVLPGALTGVTLVCALLSVYPPGTGLVAASPGTLSRGAPASPLLTAVGAVSRDPAAALRWYDPFTGAADAAAAVADALERRAAPPGAAEGGALREAACSSGAIGCRPPAAPPCAEGGCPAVDADPAFNSSRPAGAPLGGAPGWVEQCVFPSAQRNPLADRRFARMPPSPAAQYPGGGQECVLRRAPCFGRGTRLPGGGCRCLEGFAGGSCGRCAPGFRGGEWETLSNGERREWPCTPQAGAPSAPSAPPCRTVHESFPAEDPPERFRRLYSPEAPREQASPALGPSRQFARRISSPRIAAAGGGLVEVCVGLLLLDAPPNADGGVRLVASDLPLPPSDCGAVPQGLRAQCAEAPHGLLSATPGVTTALLLGPLRPARFSGVNFGGGEEGDRAVYSCARRSWANSTLHVHVETYGPNSEDFLVAVTSLVVRACSA